jgi:hypothetical protein
LAHWGCCVMEETYNERAVWDLIKEVHIFVQAFIYF